MKSLLVVLLLAFASPGLAASLEPAPEDSASVKSLDLDVSGGALFEIPATTFT